MAQLVTANCVYLASKFNSFQNHFLMRIFSLIFGMIFPALVFAQTKKLQPTVKSATFFPGGVEISMEVSTDAKAGTQVYQIMGLPAELTENDFVFDGKGGFILKSMRLKTRPFLDESTIGKLTPQLEKMEDFHRDIEKLEREIELVRKEREMLEKNKSIAGQQTLTAVVWRDAVNFYQERMKNLQEREDQLLLQHREKRRDRYRMGGDISRSLYATRRNEKFLEVEIEVEKSGAIQFMLSVISREGGWNPQYELRSHFPENKLEVLHQASFFQQTGSDWKNVKIRFTNTIPQKVTRIPDIDDIRFRTPSFKQFPSFNLGGFTGTLSGKVTENQSSMGIPSVNIELIDQYGKVITHHTTDDKGYYQINTQEPVFQMKVYTWDFEIYSTYPSSEFSQVHLTR
ncbi:MAG: DUF4139 domain-containing protein, partial [Flavobacteriales bacterium]